MILKRNYYSRNTIKVAQDLLGCFLVREYRGKIIKAMITETEAYRGEYDLACHTSKGKTARTEIMYGEAGHAYVYMIYGMYFMLNVVTEEKDFPAAVLVRGIEIKKHLPLEKGDARRAEGFEKKNKTFESSSNPPFPKEEVIKLNGPGKLTKFLHIDKSLNGHDLTEGRKLWVECLASKSKFKIRKSPRVGIDYAKRCKEWKWNFKLV